MNLESRHGPMKEGDDEFKQGYQDLGVRAMLESIHAAASRVE